MRARFAVVAIAASLAGCLEESEVVLPRPFETANGVVVYELGPRLQQCAPIVITLSQSVAKLAGAGVEPLGSSCGVRTGFFFPAVCGAPTGDILLHKISGDDVPAALTQGFALADDLVNPASMTGWEPAACPA
jgi:hypothetical protein